MCESRLYGRVARLPSLASDLDSFSSSLKRRLRVYKTLLCLTNLYRTRVPPMLKYLDHVAAGIAASRYEVCKSIEPALPEAGRDLPKGMIRVMEENNA